MIQNIVDVVCITKTRQKKKIMRKRFIIIYRYNHSCIDNEAAAM